MLPQSWQGRLGIPSIHRFLWQFSTSQILHLVHKQENNAREAHPNQSTIAHLMCQRRGLRPVSTLIP